MNLSAARFVPKVMVAVETELAEESVDARDIQSVETPAALESSLLVVVRGMPVSLRVVEIMVEGSFTQ